MKNYLNCRSTSARALLALVLFTAGGCLVVKAASFRPEATSSAPQRTLTFADRVAYQRAVEEVYWLHRIWPKENPGPKPSLDEVMSQEQIQQKVEEYLRNSQLLADQWLRTITPEQLQAEINRMLLTPDNLKCSGSCSPRWVTIRLSSPSVWPDRSCRSGWWASYMSGRTHRSRLSPRARWQPKRKHLR